MAPRRESNPLYKLAPRGFYVVYAEPSRVGYLLHAWTMYEHVVCMSQRHEHLNSVGLRLDFYTSLPLNYRF